jgi:hypothetical protein
MKATRQLLCNLLDSPQDFLKHIHQCVIYRFALTISSNGSHRMIGQTSLSIAYGIDVAPQDDPIITRTDEALEGVYLSQSRGLLFNFVPFCTP